MRKALFISNRKFIENGYPEGGVKFCTDEFIGVIKQEADVNFFPVDINISLNYRIRKKLGLSSYHEYDTEKYRAPLEQVLRSGEIKYVFLNLSNTAPFASLIRSINKNVRVILCSHGNESGDTLHDIVMHKNPSGLNSRLSAYSLGNMLINESEFRKDIDVVLTVSEVEEHIEKWLGAESVFMLPRMISINTISNEPVNGRIGFLSDLSHEPNYYGIKKVCESLSQLNNTSIELRLVGSGRSRGNELAMKYSFVTYLGHLNDAELEKEVSAWTFALNPVFYYSRGVSTKLGKMLGFGIPVITTDKGMRGYKWKNGQLPVCQTADDMANIINTLSVNAERIAFYKNEVIKIQMSATAAETMSKEIFKMIDAP